MRHHTVSELEKTAERNLWRFTLTEDHHQYGAGVENHVRRQVHVCYIELNNFQNGAFPRRTREHIDEITNIWYEASYGERRRGLRQNGQWEKDPDFRPITIQLGRDLKEEIVRGAQRAWWSFIYANGIMEELSALKYFQDRRRPLELVAETEQLQ